MLKRLTRVFEDIADDLGYFAKRSSTFLLGKAGGEVGGMGVAMAAGPLLGIIAGTVGVEAPLLGSYLAVTLAAGAVAGVSGYLVQKDFLHRREKLVDRYREEIGALIQKAPDKVTEQDVELIARGDFKRGIEANPAIRKELKNSWLERNVGVILSAVVAAATFLLIQNFDPGQLHALSHGSDLFSAAFAHTSTSGILEFIGKAAGGLAINGLAGFATYHTIKTPLHMLASDVLGIEENTVNERITTIKRTLGHGHEVKPEQVLSVFIQAHQDVAEQIKAEYGKKFDDMSPAEHKKILTMMQSYMDINGLTEDINKGRMRPEELAFISFGQKSGVGKHEDGTYKHHGNVIDGMWKGLSALTSGFTAHARPTSSKEMASFVGDMPGQTTYSIHAPNANDASMHIQNEFEEPGHKQSFVARVGRKVSDDGLSHVERLEQSSSQEILINR
jgi:hypothetical protein